MTEQTRKSTEVRRHEIVAAGMHILAEDGSRQFTAERLGAAIGISGGTIFRHFASMDEILDAIVGRIEEIIFADFPPDAADPISSLRIFFEKRVDVIRKNPEVSRLLLTQGLIPNFNSQKREERLNELKRRSQLFVIGCLKEAKQKGRLASGVEPREGALLVLGAIYAAGHMQVRSGRAAGGVDLTARTWALLERALIGNAGAGR
ncbi:MAG: TetR/AcrR family transcriptional regulator [candidate division Zixibacteria bacterium]|nr:TetR/AcrR family transcriptional regulator [candidate division Zixibacteria bacterium]